MKNFQKKKENLNQAIVFRTPDWFKGKAVPTKKAASFKPVSFQGTQHRG